MVPRGQQRSRIRNALWEANQSRGKNEVIGKWCKESGFLNHERYANSRTGEKFVLSAHLNFHC